VSIPEMFVSWRQVSIDPVEIYRELMNLSEEARQQVVCELLEENPSFKAAIAAKIHHVLHGA